MLNDYSLHPKEGVNGLPFELGLMEPQEWEAFSEAMSVAVAAAGLEYCCYGPDGSVVLVDGEPADHRSVLHAWSSEGYEVVVS
jgi:hypothetical protein